jgi:hypothetical protein
MRPNKLPLILVAVGLSLLSGSSAFGINQKQARKLVSQIAGSNLPSSAVTIKSLSENGSDAEARVELETAFRLVQDKDNHWQVVEVRVGQGRWEEISILATAFKRPAPELACTSRERSLSDEFVAAIRARCLLANLLNVELPSDAVRIKSVSSLGVPLASPSVVVVARVQADVKFVKDQKDWRVSQVRTGKSDWVNIEGAVAALDDAKRKRATEDLGILARALEQFRTSRGFYVVSDKEHVLIDHLSPRYLGRVIRLDPWGNSYRYQGESNHFQLSSAGPDGKENTPDDIVVTGSGPRPS